MKEAEDLFNSIRKDESLISQARKEQALDIAKVQTGVDVGFEDDLETAMSHSRDGHGLPLSCSHSPDTATQTPTLAPHAPSSRLPVSLHGPSPSRLPPVPTALSLPTQRVSHSSALPTTLHGKSSTPDTSYAQTSSFPLFPSFLPTRPPPRLRRSLPTFPNPNQHPSASSPTPTAVPSRSPTSPAPPCRSSTAGRALHRRSHTPSQSHKSFRTRAILHSPPTLLYVGGNVSSVMRPALSLPSLPQLPRYPTSCADSPLLSHLTPPSPHQLLMHP